MDRMHLEQIEADVVLVAINSPAGTVHIQPLWECDIPPEKLPETAAQFGLWANEQNGCGYVRVEIHDFRVKV